MSTLKPTTDHVVNLDAFQISINRASEVTILGIAPDGSICCSYDQFLRAAITFLHQPLVADRIPHAALGRDQSPLVLAPVVAQSLALMAASYPDIYGRPDQQGVNSIFEKSPKSESATVTWGNGAASLTVNRTTYSIELSTNNPMSLELLADIFITVLRDPVTKHYNSNFYAPFLRRWGERAFEQSTLRQGFPSKLSRAVKLSPAGEIGAPLAGGDTTPLNASSETLRIPSSAQRRGRPPKHDQALQKRAEQLRQREEEVNQQQKTIMGRLRELAEKGERLDQAQRAVETHAATLAKLEVAVRERERSLNQQSEALQEREDNLGTRERLSHEQTVAAQRLLIEAQNERQYAEAVRAEVNNRLAQVITPPQEN